MESPPRAILDPSLLFADDALDWLSDPELQPFLVVSSALWQRLEDATSFDEFLPFGAQVDANRIGLLRDALNRMPKFSYADVEPRSDDSRAILNALLASDAPLAEVLADEWVFVTSQSIGLFSEDTQRTLHEFTKAGAQIYTVGRNWMRRALESFRETLPPGLLRVMKTVGRFPGGTGAKVVMFGGDIALLLLPIPYLGLGAGIASAVQQGVGVIAGDP